MHRSEGILLRYISSVYKVLQQTLSDDIKNDEIDTIIDFLKEMLKSTDSSLIKEWNVHSISDNKNIADNLDKEEENNDDITKNERKLLFLFVIVLYFKRFFI